MEFTTSDAYVELGGLIAAPVWTESPHKYQVKMCGIGTTEPCIYQYSIPPQKPANKTLLLMAAYEAFREAGLSGAMALNNVTSDASCFENYIVKDEQELFKDAGDDLEKPLWQVFGVEFGEANERLMETVDILASHQIAVGDSSLSKYSDHGEAQEMRWAGSINSRTAVMRLIAGMNSTAVAEPCLIELQSDGVRSALEFLRSGRPASIFDDEAPIATIQEVAEQAYQFIIDDMTVTEPLPNPLPLDEYMRRRGFNYTDLEQARQYLKEESLAHARVRKLTEPGGDRLVNLNEPTFDHPPSYWQAQAMGMEARVPYNAFMQLLIWRQSALDYLHYTRQAAVKVLLANDTATHRIRQLYSPTAHDLHIQAGDRWVRVYMEKVDATNILVDVSVNGKFPMSDPSTSMETVLLVKSEEGYRCFAEGSIDGEPCKASDYLKGSNDQPTGDPESLDPFGQTITVSLTEENLLNEKFYVFRKLANGSLDLMAGFMVTFYEGDTKRELKIPAGGEMVKKLSDIMRRSKRDCSMARMCCVGLPCGLVPPLENEITSDEPTNTGFETSWKHYLTLATQAAAEADRLGDELIRAGLEMDMKAEEAVKELEAICGGVVNVPDTFSTPETPGTEGDILDQSYNPDGSLQQCLPGQEGTEKIDFVSLGVPVCMYRPPNGTVCGCPEPPCPICPMESEENEGVAGCTNRYESAPESPVKVSEGWEVIHVPTSLNIFQKPKEDINSDKVKVEVNCKLVQDMRAAFLYHAYDEGATENATPLADMYEKLQDQPWLSRDGFIRLQNRLTLDTDPFYHYNMLENGSVLWSTHRAKMGGRCPLRVPYRAEHETDNMEIFCDHCDAEEPEPEQDGYYGDQVYRCHGVMPGAWVANEFLLGSKSAVAERIRWGVRLGNIMKTISMLTGRLDGFMVPHRNYRGNKEYNDQDDPLPPIGFPWSMINGESEGLDSRACIQLPYNKYHVITNDAFHDPYHTSDRLLRDLVDCELEDGDCSRAEIGLSRWQTLGSMNRCSDHDGRIHFEDYSGPYREWEGNSVSGVVPSNTGIVDTAGFVDYSEYFWDNGGVKAVLINSDSFKERLPHPESEYCMFDNWLDPVRRNSCCTKPFGRWLSNIQIYKDDDYIAPYACMSANRMYDALELACFIAAKDDPSCLTIKNLPAVNSKEDIESFARFMECAANQINKSFATMVVARVPKMLVDGFQSGGVQSYYGSVSGQRLEAVAAMETALRQIATGMDRISGTVIETAALVRTTNSKIIVAELQGEIGRLRSMQKMLETAIAAFQFTEQSAQMAAGGGGCAVYGAMRGAMGNMAFQAIMDAESQIMNLQQEVTENETAMHVNQLVHDVAVKFGALKDTLKSMEDGYSNLQVASDKLEQLEKKALSLSARAAFADSDSAGHVFPVNTVMRRRYNTLRIRYQNALNRAKKLAFIARRAIEFRLGVDMSKMDNPPMLQPEAPSEWVDDICKMEGLDYSRIRDMDATDYASGWDGTTDNYAHQYIGDYVQKLNDFVESYSFDYPFHESEDVAVISLKDDIIRARKECLAESYNRLYNSDDLGSGKTIDGSFRGWRLEIEDCNAPGEVDTCIKVLANDSLAWIDEGFCYGMYPESSTCDSTYLVPSRAERIKDVVRTQTERWLESGDATELVWTRPDYGTHSGYVSQVTDVLEPGDYLLSWWHKCPTDLSGCVEYKVEVKDVGDATNVSLAPTFVGIPGRSPGEMSGNVWTKTVINFTVTIAKRIEIRIHPSADDATSDQTGGEFWMWGVQLEKIDPARCPSIADCEPLPFQRVKLERMAELPDCPDHSGEKMRQAFGKKICVCEGKNGACPSGREDPSKQCYYQYGFTLTLNDIESGRLIPSAAIAINNFNYRHNTTAVNLVGSNVRYCVPNSPATCYSNSYVPYTLEHDGTVMVRNHSRQSLEFHMPTARIEHGKGLAAEVLITNPLSGSHSTLISPYEKRELRGRPIQGQYTIRIWETPELVWGNVEDIQLVWKYRYWTQFSN